jgi:hypothetical protein
MARPKKIQPPDPDAFTGDVTESISGLLLLLGTRRDQFAREAIIAECERLFDSTIYAHNRDVISIEKNQRLAELYSRSNCGAGRKNGYPIV